MEDQKKVYWTIGYRDGITNVFARIRKGESITDLAQSYIEQFGDNPHAKWIIEQQKDTGPRP